MEYYTFNTAEKLIMATKRCILTKYYDSYSVFSLGEEKATRLTPNDCSWNNCDFLNNIIRLQSFVNGVMFINMDTATVIEYNGISVFNRGEMYPNGIIAEKIESGINSNFYVFSNDGILLRKFENSLKIDVIENNKGEIAGFLMHCLHENRYYQF